ncbi:hypothetical protein JCM8547_002443 [Rhodosporidiobolus lusitaniae]
MSHAHPQEPMGQAERAWHEKQEELLPLLNRNSNSHAEEQRRLRQLRQGYSDLARLHVASVEEKLLEAHPGLRTSPRDLSEALEKEGAEADKELKEEAGAMARRAEEVHGTAHAINNASLLPFYHAQVFAALSARAETVLASAPPPRRRRFSAHDGQVRRQSGEWDRPDQGQGYDPPAFLEMGRGSGRRSRRNPYEVLAR